MTQNSRINRFFQFMVILFYIGYGVSCGILYYRQSIQMGGNYYSDLVAHIRSGVYGEGGYSIAYKILGMFYKISGDTRLVAVFLAVVSCLTVFGVYYVLKKLLESQNIAVPPVMVHLYAWACSFAMSIYVPGVYEHFYGGTITGQAWHNSTYLQMRLLGIFLLLLYFTMQKTYLKHIKLSSAAVFMVGLIVINMIKPNFILAFAPMMAVNLCVDLFAVHMPFQEKFRQIFLFGACVLPSLVVLLIQNQLLYHGEDSESGIAVDIGYSFLRSGNPYAKILLGLAFPLFILCFHYRELIRDRIYGSIWLMWGISFLEYLVFVETGKRQNHGNFAWGMIFSTFMVFVISIYKMASSRQGGDKQGKIYYIGAYGLLALHTISGLCYFITLLQGQTYIR